MDENARLDPPLGHGGKNLVKRQNRRFRARSPELESQGRGGLLARDRDPYALEVVLAELARRHDDGTVAVPEGRSVR